MKNFNRYFKAINYLEGLSNLPLKGDYMIGQGNLEMYLKRMRYFLNLIGNPDKGMKYVHVTGTSGKGTVTNMVHEILSAAGRNVGSFTSPFVTTSIEKIKVRDKYIAPDELADIVDYLKPFIDKAYMEGPYGRPSYYELSFAIVLIYFKRKKCDWVVLEVGCGGRYDATNVIEKPVVTAITMIDYDHMELLGKTLKKIAYEKAGIIKSGSVFFTAEQRPALLKMFAEICAEKHVEFHQIPHQADYMEYNKALAAAIAQNIGMSDATIKKGIEGARLQCRFEIVQRDPFVVIDGAHNRSKIRSTVSNLKKLKFNKLHLILGMADNKDQMTILGDIIPEAAHVYLTRFQVKDRKCAHLKKLFAKGKEFLKKGAKIEMFLDSSVALDTALKNAGKNDLIIVAGSFFLAGELRKRWFPEEWVLEKRKSF